MVMLNLPCPFDLAGNGSLHCEKQRKSLELHDDNEREDFGYLIHLTETARRDYFIIILLPMRS